MAPNIDVLGYDPLYYENAPKIQGNYEIYGEKLYDSHSNEFQHVIKEDPINGKTLYLLDSQNHIIASEHYQGTSFFERAQKFYIQNEGAIIGTASLVIVGGLVLVLAKNPQLAVGAARISGAALVKL
jgi:hypothetical protein